MSRSVHHASDVAARWARRLHGACTWVVGAQIGVWAFTGVAFAWTDFDAVHAVGERAGPEAVDASAIRVSVEGAIKAAARLAFGGELGAQGVTGVRFKAVGGKPMAVVSFSNGRTALVDAVSGEAREAISAADAERVAERAYKGGRTPRRVDWIGGQGADAAANANADANANAYAFATAVDLERPVYRACYDDDKGTCAFVNPRDGEIAAFRNRAWYRFDTLFSLHVLGYVSRENPSHGPMRALAGVTLVAVLSGMALGAARMFRKVRRRGVFRRASPCANGSTLP